MLSAHWRLVLKLMKLDVKEQYEELEEGRDQKTRTCTLDLACALAFVDNTLWQSPLHTKMTANICYLDRYEV